MARSVLLSLVLFALPARTRAQAPELEIGGTVLGQLAASLSPGAPRELGLIDTPWLAYGGGVRLFLRDPESGTGGSLGYTGSATVGGSDESDDLERHAVDVRFSTRVGRTSDDRFGLLLEIGPSLGVLVGRTNSCSGSGWPDGYRTSLEPWEVVSRYEPADPRSCTATTRASFALGGSAVLGIELHFGPLVLLPQLTYRVTAAPVDGLVEHELAFGLAIGLSASGRADAPSPRSP